MKERVVVVCPGRGTYNKEELGYLKRLHGDQGALIEGIDRYRAGVGQSSIAGLDAMARYSLKLHSSGENASALIYACAYADFLAIDRERYEVVAVTGNSMGWYIALACAGALAPDNAIRLINTMGSMMTDGLIGGQLLYPLVDEQWQADGALKDTLERAVAEVQAEPGCELYTSIELGGYRVLGGNESALKRLEQRLPVVQDRFPMRLYNHAAFHTPLLEAVSERARLQLPASLFEAPALPLVDGRGALWQPYSTDPVALHDYTLGHQVVAPYDFSRAIEVAVKEFAPDRLLITGPGTTLGGSVAQVLAKLGWEGITRKADFVARQQTDPYLLAMGHEEQRKRVLA
ncbi:ACP S-malonyltransferase [Aestuariirhabdus litorea]|uniref:[acyl-carrier-protein] S-malonyltransferase n=1 Tax=Aestuariirhabdus litorea TaxID=2528527 RepID=A0A3P3VT41_9GAMM|nr:ACP S-malonyltransferase [Aestuariirhabdus litorea]RRJ83933.1 ACP S-malonyltransferase [Aestuariirhabdus litorea]RWW97155.1 ACP S-malonyltransferase [Endozoicomonadaceae bacterium GTF-13]